jgi:hypothetical protein
MFCFCDAWNYILYVAIRSRVMHSASLPLQRISVEHPYAEEDCTVLEELVIPTIQRCLARIDELDPRLLAEQELLHRCQLEAEREVLGELRLQMA